MKRTKLRHGVHGEPKGKPKFTRDEEVPEKLRADEDAPPPGLFERETYDPERGYV